MQTLLFLMEEGSIAKAALRVPLTQPAVTKHIQRLEHLLGTDLVDRRQKPLKLTPNGLIAAEHCRQILGQIDALRSQFQPTKVEGILRLGVATGFASDRVGAAIQAMTAKFPLVTVRLSTAWSDDLKQRLQDGALDAALVLDEPTHEPSGLGVEELVIVGATELVGDGRWTKAGLRSQSWVLSEAPCAARRALSAQLLRGGESLKIAAEVQESTLQLSLVRDGVGFSVLPARLLDSEQVTGIAAIEGFRVKLTMQMLRSPYLGRLSAAVDAAELAVRSI